MLWELAILQKECLKMILSMKRQEITSLMQLRNGGKQEILKISH